MQAGGNNRIGKALVPAAAMMALGLAPMPAWACGTYTPESHIRLSELVADGEITCDRASNACELNVSSILKPDAETTDIQTVKIRADYHMRQVDLTEDRLTIYCTPLFQPEESTFFGRFYLRRLEDGRYRVSLSLRPDEDGNYPDS